jgi:hypothetical protein
LHDATPLALLELSKKKKVIGGNLVEAAGVEPAQDVENTQVVDPNNGQNGKKDQKGKSTVQTLYKMSFHDRPATQGLTHPSILPKMVPPQAHFWCCPLS